jgi:hypothetical protein
MNKFKVGDLVKQRIFGPGANIGVVIGHDKRLKMVKVRWAEPKYSPSENKEREVTTEHPELLKVVSQ